MFLQQILFTFSIIYITDATVSRPAWGKDQPNNYNGEQNCAVLDGGRGWLWNDVGCNLDYLHWICQYCEYIFNTPFLIALIELNIIYQSNIQCSIEMFSSSARKVWIT